MEGEGSSTEVHDVPQSMAFTVTFNNFNPNKSKVINSKFVKRHIRNLSLPIPQLYDINSPPEINGKVVKNLGNHSEGYFSSDPEEDHPKILSKAIDFEKSVDIQVDCEQMGENDCDSDVASETGTYTVEKESTEVVNARLSFDHKYLDSSPQLVTSRDSPHWINEWATQVVSHNEQSKPNSTPKTKPSTPNSRGAASVAVSKIPSAVVTRTRSTSTRMEVVKSRSQTESVKSINLKQEEGDEAERHLKTTERMMEALAARLSMDSESEPEIGVATDSSASESTKSSRPLVAPTTPLSRRKSLSEENASKKVVTSKVKKEEVVFKKPLPPKSKTPNPPSINRTDTGRFSMRATNHPPSPQLSKPGVVKKKAVGGARSNSTLSSKEVEFQNWKRRKSYDPMKAAAEGKKKDNRKATVAPVQTPTGSTSVLRSASFHGTRQLGVTTAPLPSSSDDEDVQTSKDWQGLQAPRTSRETTPQGSRVSLCSNSSSPRTRHKLEGIDNLVVTAVANLSAKLKLGSSNLLRKLRCLYDEESEKSKQLTHEIDQLELVSEPPSPHRSPSKELASTLRNLKRLDSMLKVLDEVLFDDTDFE